MKRKGWMERIALVAAHWSGSTAAFILAAAVVLVWLVTGPIFGFSDTWQLVINTGTTIVTFLMVFLIQRSQNKEAVALQLKLNELVAAIEGASNRLINIEDLSEQEISTLHKHYNTLSRLAAHDGNLTQSHSIEEAEQRHARKHSRHRNT
jgi:low affinity Fe/Cu permease